MSETWDAAWRNVRARRATSFGRTAGDPQRRAVYLSALEQAEQFAVGARAVGVATRPVLLFYALSQAGRAIAADLAEADWEIRGHGAGPRVPGDPSTMDFVLDHVVRAEETGRGAFPTVSRATGSPVSPEPMTIRSLWESLPELQRISSRAGLRSDGSLSFTPEVSRADRSSGAVAAIAARHTQAHFAFVKGGLKAALDRYPLARGYEIRMVPNPLGPIPVVVWPDPSAKFGYRFVWDVGYEVGGGYYIRPPVTGDGVTPSPLMTWWALLLGLSSIARYHPAEWRAALDPDSSVLAVPLAAAGSRRAAGATAG